MRDWCSVVYNLSTNRDNFARMVVDGVPRLLVSMLSASSSSVRNLVLHSMVLLSCAQTPRAKLIEEGVVSAIRKVSVGLSDQTAAQQLSLVLEHLAGDESALKMIVDEGCIQVRARVDAVLVATGHDACS